MHVKACLDASSRIYLLHKYVLPHSPYATSSGG